MKTYQKTALVSAAILLSGFASASTKLSEVDLTNVKTINSTVDVSWDINNPLVNKTSAKPGDSLADERSSYRQSQRILVKDVVDANIALDNMVANSLAGALKSQPEIASKMTGGNASDAHFEVAVYDWGLYSYSNDRTSDVKPVIGLKVELVDNNGQSLWHTYQRVSASNPSTPSDTAAAYLDNSDRLEAAFNQAVNAATTKVANSL